MDFHRAMQGETERIDPNAVSDKKINTDVHGLASDGVYKKGMLEFPIFDVDKQDFYNNMEAHRSRTRFSSDSKASKYMRMTRYNQPFYIRYNDEGRQYIRKIK